eukprot:3074427-Rhodomonas_salina.2
MEKLKAVWYYFVPAGMSRLYRHGEIQPGTSRTSESRSAWFWIAQHAGSYRSCHPVWYCKMEVLVVVHRPYTRGHVFATSCNRRRNTVLVICMAWSPICRLLQLPRPRESRQRTAHRASSFCCINPSARGGRTKAKSVVAPRDAAGLVLTGWTFRRDLTEERKSETEVHSKRMRTAAL